MSIRYGTTLVIKIAEPILTTPALAMSFFRIFTPPISAPITKALVILQRPNVCTRMMLAMIALIAGE